MTSRTTAFAVLILLACLVACGPPAERPRNLLLISADSLRADRLALFREGGLELPTLDRLAERGVVYRGALAVTPWTAPAMVSVFTGLYPPSHGVQVRDDTTPATLPTLVRLAQAGGLRIGNFSFFSGISYFRNLGLPAAPEGLAHGREPEIFARWLDEEPDEAFFAWIHLLEPHLPYGASGYRAKDLQIEGSSGLEASQLRATVPVGTAEFEDGDRQLLLELYDQDVVRLEERLSEIVRALEQRGALDDTLIVFVADHGEELLEDGWVGHASTAAEAKLIPEVLEIPLLVSGPGVRRPGTTEEAMVQQVDVLPAVVDAFGWSKPRQLDGLGLPGVGRRRVTPRRLSYFDSSVGGNLTPAERAAERLQGVSDGSCLLRSATRPGSSESQSQLPLDGGGCSSVDLLDRLLGEWRREQAEQRVELLRGAAMEAGPDPAEVDQYALSVELRRPPSEMRLTWRGEGGLIDLGWEVDGPTWVEYRVGEGLLSVEGVFRVDSANGISFGPFPEGFWNDLAGYNPFRFRVLDEEGRRRSEWREFELLSTREAAGAAGVR